MLPSPEHPFMMYLNKHDVTMKSNNILITQTYFFE